MNFRSGAQQNRPCDIVCRQSAVSPQGPVILLVLRVSSAGDVSVPVDIFRPLTIPYPNGKQHSPSVQLCSLHQAMVWALEHYTNWG